jgi:hypothetical protein
LHAVVGRESEPFAVVNSELEGGRGGRSAGRAKQDQKKKLFHSIKLSILKARGKGFAFSGLGPFGVSWGHRWDRISAHFRFRAHQ